MGWVTTFFPIVPLQSWVVGLIWQMFCLLLFWMLITVTFSATIFSNTRWSAFAREGWQSYICLHQIRPGVAGNLGGTWQSLHQAHLACALWCLTLTPGYVARCNHFYSLSLFFFKRPQHYPTGSATGCNCIKLIW